MIAHGPVGYTIGVLRDADLQRRFAAAGARWLQVAVKPAKPFAFCTLAPDDVPVFGLPGNPSSTMVTFEIFARAAISPTPASKPCSAAPLAPMRTSWANRRSSS